MDNLDNDLASAEESMLSRLRAPLNRSDPAGDLAKRLREQEVKPVTPWKYSTLDSIIFIILKSQRLCVLEILSNCHSTIALLAH